jgi:hypothetical protein
MAAPMEVDTLSAPPTQRTVVTSVYKRMKSFPQEGRGPVVIPLDGSVQSTFLLPSNQAINLYRSYLRFQLAFDQPPAQHRTVIRSDRVPFSAVALMAGGVELFNIPKDADLLSAAVNPICTAFDDYVADGWCDGDQDVGIVGNTEWLAALTGLQWCPYGQWGTVNGGQNHELEGAAIALLGGANQVALFGGFSRPRRFGGVLLAPSGSGSHMVQTPAVPQVDNKGALPIPSCSAAPGDGTFRNPSSPYPIMHIWVQPGAELDAAEGAVNWELPLHRLAPHTILTYDKDTIWPITPELRLVWNPMSAMAWTQSQCALDNGTTPGASFPAGPFYNASGLDGGLGVNSGTGAPGALTPPGAGLVTGLQLDIAVNYDVGLISAMQSQLAGPGFTMRLPWPIMQDRVIQSASAGTNDFKLNPNLGSNLLRIYNFVAWTDALATITTAKRNIEAGGLLTTKLNFLRTNMAGSPLQQEAVTFSRRGEAWKFMKPLVTGSAIQSYSDWVQNGCVWVDEFANGVDPIALSRQVTDWADAGVALDRDMFYQCELTAYAFPPNVSARMIMVLIVQKELQISSGGVVVRA